MARRRPRGLSAEDRALWEQVKASTAPLHAQPETGPSAPPGPAPVPPPTPAPEVVPVPAFEIGAKAGNSAPIGTGPAPAAPDRMHRKPLARLRRGRQVPEARLDLHGLTLDAAHPALTSFVASAQARGLRLVLVITGKGREDGDTGPMPERRGILRQQVPQWLSAPPLRALVQETLPAHRRHGGAGALYVTLRRRRK